MLQTTPPEPHGTVLSRAGGVHPSSGILRSPVVYFLGALVLIFVSAPFIEQLRGGNLIESVLITLVFLSAVTAVGGRRRTLVWAVVLVIPPLVGRWVNHLGADLLPPEIFLGAALLFVVFIVVNLLGFILRAPRVNSEILCAGVATYLMLGWFWAFAYILVARAAPDSFVFTAGPASVRSMRGFRSLYFSYATLTTVGYGDIIPVSGGARMLAMAEAIAGVFYVTLMIARLVALYYSKGPPSRVSD